MKEQTASQDLVSRIYNHWTFPGATGLLGGSSMLTAAYLATEYPIVGQMSALLLSAVLVAYGISRAQRHSREMGNIDYDPVRGEARGGLFFGASVLGAAAVGAYLLYLQQ